MMSASSVLRRPNLIVIASWGARQGTSSPLLRFVRDNVPVLKRFEVHATGGTARSILGTGLYTPADVFPHRTGADGGIVELAAMVARRVCRTVIFLSDPKDLRSNVPENYAFQRMCKELQVYLITTHDGAEQWAAYEALQQSGEDSWTRGGGSVLPPNWREGERNVEDGEPTYPPLEKQTLALISHDAKKEDMALFVSVYHGVLARFDRILTTGTTGYLLKMLFAPSRAAAIEDEARSQLKDHRFQSVKESVWEIRLKYCPEKAKSDVEAAAMHAIGAPALVALQKKIEREADATRERMRGFSAAVFGEPHADLVDRVMPLPSGPRGGDILIASEVLENRCHAVVFFQDPQTAQPHEPDIRLFERTCQFWSDADPEKAVFSTCVSSPDAAIQWVERLDRMTRPNERGTPNLAHRLRRMHGLRDVVIVDARDGAEPEEIGRALARACGGYIHRWLAEAARRQQRLRVGVAHGWTVLQVLREIQQMEKDGLLTALERRTDLEWSALVGNTTVEWREREAATIAERFCDQFGGAVRTFRSSGFVSRGHLEAGIGPDDRRLIADLALADLILAVASPWNESNGLYRDTALDKARFPTFAEAAGTLSTVFLKPESGEPVDWPLAEVGLGHAGFREAAKRGGVVVMCGGPDRDDVLRALIAGRLVSVLITTRASAERLA